MTSTLVAQQKASRTAYDCAAARAHVFASTGLRSFDYLAAHVVSGGSASLRARIGVALVKLGATGLTQKLVSTASPGSDVFMFARQTVPDEMIREALLAHPQTQAVILGAGLDTSGLRIATERRAAGMAPGAFFEVDLPAMLDAKRVVAERLTTLAPNLDGSHIRYVPCSFGENELATSLRTAGFDPSLPAIWVWSGVVHYLTEAAVRATVADLKRLSSAGSKLFFDFIVLEAYTRPVDYGFAQVKRRFDSFGEVMSFGFRQGTDHVREWLASEGLTFVRSYTSDDMVELYQRQTGRAAPSRGTPWSNLCVAEF